MFEFKWQLRRNRDRHGDGFSQAMGKRKQRDSGCDSADNGSISACGSQGTRGSQPSSQRVRGIGLCKPSGNITKPLVSISNPDKLQQLQRKDSTVSTCHQDDGDLEVLPSSASLHSSNEGKNPEYVKGGVRLHVKAAQTDEPTRPVLCDANHWPGFTTGLQISAQQLQQQAGQLSTCSHGSWKIQGLQLQQQQQRGGGITKVEAVHDQRRSWHAAKATGMQAPGPNIRSDHRHFRADNAGCAQMSHVSFAAHHVPATMPQLRQDVHKRPYDTMMSATAAAAAAAAGKLEGQGHNNGTVDLPHARAFCKMPGQQHTIILQPHQAHATDGSKDVMLEDQLPLQPTLPAGENSQPARPDCCPVLKDSINSRVLAKAACPASQLRQEGASACALQNYPPCGATGPPPGPRSGLALGPPYAQPQAHHFAHIMHTTAWHQQDQAQQHTVQLQHGHGSINAAIPPLDRKHNQQPPQTYVMQSGMAVGAEGVNAWSQAQRCHLQQPGSNANPFEPMQTAMQGQPLPMLAPVQSKSVQVTHQHSIAAAEHAGSQQTGLGSATQDAAACASTLAHVEPAGCMAGTMQPTLLWPSVLRQADLNAGHSQAAQQQQQPWLHPWQGEKPPTCKPTAHNMQQKQDLPGHLKVEPMHAKNACFASARASTHTAAGRLPDERCIPHCYYRMGLWVPHPKYLMPAAASAIAPRPQMQQQQQQQGSTIPAIPTCHSRLAEQHTTTAQPHLGGDDPSPLLAVSDSCSAFKRPLRTELAAWVQHQGVLDAYAAKGVTSLYPWQAAAMECGEDGRNLVYCAPTSGGKSMVAELLLVRQLVKYGSTRKAFGKRLGPPARALLVLPYISIVSEKATHMSQVLAGLGGTVRGYMGDTMSTPLADKDELLAVVTMEKANVALNKLIAQQRIQELVAVAVDEAHMVSDPSRGLSLELLLTKLMHARACLPEVASRLQIVAMSATMSGLEQMRAWLNARLFMTNYRPVPLTEYAVFRHQVFRKRSPLELVEYRQQQQAAQDEMWQQAEQAALGRDESASEVPAAATKLWAPSTGDVLAEERVLPAAPGVSKCDGLVPLVAEVVQHGHSVLVFCAGRDSCQSVAKITADNLPGLLPKPWEDQVLVKRAQVIADLRECSGDVANPLLEALIGAGVAYHHAGMTDQERNAVEQAYRDGAILVITATSTLAAGVNLPARRVILRSLQQGIGPVSRAQYLQMIGRAGRAGQSSIGEAFLLGAGNPHDARGQWTPVCQLLTAPLPPLRSRLLDRPEGNLMMLGKAGKAKVKGQAGRPARVTASGNGPCHAAPAAPSPVIELGSTSGSSAAVAQQGCLDSMAAAAAVVATNSHIAAAAVPFNSHEAAAAVPSNNHTAADGVPVPVAATANNQEAMRDLKDAVADVTDQHCDTHCSEGKGSGGHSSGGAEGHGKKEKTWHVPEETHLQHVLMDAIGNGSVSCPHSIMQFLKSTLIYQQAPASVLEQAMLTALTNLQDVGLISVLPADQVELDMHPSLLAQLAGHQQHQQQHNHIGSKQTRATSCKVQAYLPRRACVTPLGHAVFGSRLPLHLAMDLYKRLLAAQIQGMVMASGPLHPICIVIANEQEEFSIGNWMQWARLLRSCNDLERKVARLMGVEWEAAEVQHLRVNKLAHVEKAHARFAAGLCLTQLVCEGDMCDLEQQWGKEGGLLARGLTRGSLQRLQKQLKASAGMASQMCACAGWWQLETLMSQLSEQADAGARPELFKLMQVPALRDAPGRARELFERGIRDPAALAAAPESLVQQAVAAALPRSMRQTATSKLGTKGTAAAFSNPNAGNPAMVNRIASSLIQEAQHHVLSDALKVLNMAATVPDAEPAVTDAAAAVAAAAGAVSTMSAGAVPAAGSLGGSSGALSVGNASSGGSQGAQTGDQARTTVCTGMPTAAAVQHALQQVKQLQHGVQQLRIRGNARVRRLTLAADATQLQEVEALIVNAPRLSFQIVWETAEPASMAKQGKMAAPSAINAAGMQPGQRHAGQPQHDVHGTDDGCHRHLCAERASSATGIMVAWNDTEAVWLDCSSSSTQQEVTTDPHVQQAAKYTWHPLWPCISTALTSPDVSVCCFNALDHLLSLATQGISPWQLCCSSTISTAHDAINNQLNITAPLSSQQQQQQQQQQVPAHGLHVQHRARCFFDPQLMLWLFQQPQGMQLQAVTTHEVQQAVLPGYKLHPRVADSTPLPHGALDAIKTCLLAYSSSRALEAVGQMQQLMNWYQCVELPLLAARAVAASAAQMHAATALALRRTACRGDPDATLSASADTQQGPAKPKVAQTLLQSSSQQGQPGCNNDAQAAGAGCVQYQGSTAASWSCVTVQHASCEWARARNVVAARMNELMWGLSQVMPEVQQVHAMGWAHASTHHWVCHRLQLLSLPLPAHERPPINQPCTAGPPASDATGNGQSDALQSYHVAAFMQSSSRLTGDTRGGLGPTAPEAAFMADQMALRQLAMRMPAHALQQHYNVQAKVSWLLTELQQLQRWWHQQHQQEASVVQLPASQEPTHSTLNACCLVPRLCGLHGLLSSGLERRHTPAAVTTSFTDFVHMQDSLQSLQQQLGQVVREQVQQCAHNHSTQTAASQRTGSQMQPGSQAAVTTRPSSQSVGEEQRMADVCFAAQQRMCQTWTGTLVLFDACQAVHACGTVLQAAGLLQPGESPTTPATVNLRCSSQPSPFCPLASPNTGAAQKALNADKLCLQPVLCASRLIAVLLETPQVAQAGATIPSQPSPSQLAFGSQAAIDGTAIALVYLPPGVSTPATHCAAGQAAGAAAAAASSGVVAVPCSHVWLYADASRPGLVAQSLQHGYFHALCRVQVNLGCCMSWLTPSHPGYGMLHVSLPYLPLTLLSHFCNDAALSTLLVSTSPYQAMAHAWEASFHSSTPDAQQPSNLAGEPLAATAQQTTEACVNTGCNPETASVHMLQQRQLPTPERLVRMLQSAGGVCCEQGTAWVVQQLLTSWVLGEKPAQLAARLAGQAGHLDGTRSHGQHGNKRAAKELMASFMEAFPSLQSQADKLLDQALNSGGVVRSIAGRQVRVQEAADACTSHNHARKPPTSSVRASLQRAVLRELIASSIADVQRAAVSLAIQASAVTSISCEGAGQLNSMHSGSGRQVPSAQLGPVMPDGQFVLLLPKQGMLAKPNSSANVTNDAAKALQHSQATPLARGAGSIASQEGRTCQAASLCVHASQQRQQRKEEHQQRYRLHASDVGVHRAPDNKVLAAVHRAMSRGVVQKLGIQGCAQLHVDLSWGNSCDARECIHVPSME